VVRGEPCATDLYGGSRVYVNHPKKHSVKRVCSTPAVCNYRSYMFALGVCLRSGAQVVPYDSPTAAQVRSPPLGIEDPRAWQGR